MSKSYLFPIFASTRENQELGMPKFQPDNSSNTQTGMYFCSDEEVSEQNVKIGTFQSAEENCHQVLTPKICDNQMVAHKIQNLTLKAQEGFGTCLE